MERMELDLQVPHVGPRCSYCGVRAVTKGNVQWVPETPHSRRCAVTKHGASPMWGEWPDDIKAERDALREALNRLATEGADDAVE